MIGVKLELFNREVDKWKTMYYIIQKVTLP